MHRVREGKILERYSVWVDGGVTEEDREQVNESGVCLPVCLSRGWSGGAEEGGSSGVGKFELSQNGQGRRPGEGERKCGSGLREEGGWR